MTGTQGSRGYILDPQAPSSSGTFTFLVPGVDVLGVVKTPDTQDWVSTIPWPKDVEAVDYAHVQIYFSANAQATTVFDVRLFDTAPAGTSRILGHDSEQFITALSPTPVDFYIHVQGGVLNKGHTLTMELYAQTLNAAVVMSWGGATASAMHGFQVRWLDSDGDGIADSDETRAGTNPLDPSSRPGGPATDSDHDGLSDTLEVIIGTNPHNADSDGDGYLDGVEYHAGSNPLDANSKPYDLNHNGLPDTFESYYFYNGTTIQGNSTTPSGFGPHDDPDGDGCDNLCEAQHGTNPFNPDTDGDRVSDGQEVSQGTDPLSPQDTSPATTAANGVRGVPEPVAAAAAFAIAASLVLVVLLRRR